MMNDIRYTGVYFFLVLYSDMFKRYLNKSPDWLFLKLAYSSLSMLAWNKHSNKPGCYYCKWDSPLPLDKVNYPLNSSASLQSFSSVNH